MPTWVCSIKVSDRYSVNKLREKLKLASVQDYVKLRCVCVCVCVYTLPPVGFFWLHDI